MPTELGEPRSARPGFPSTYCVASSAISTALWSPVRKTETSIVGSKSNRAYWSVSSKPSTTVATSPSRRRLPSVRSFQAHHQEWWRKAPGAKWLVLGNHDVDPVNRILPFATDRTAVTLYAAGDPPLVLTHVPLLQVPHGAVNVHGHVHEQESPTPNRHVNASASSS